MRSLTTCSIVCAALASWAGCSARVDTSRDASLPIDARAALDAAPGLDAAPAPDDARVADATTSVDARVAVPDAARDAGARDAFTPISDAGRDAGSTVADAGPRDSGTVVDGGDAGPPPVFVLGAPMADCNTTCGAIGRSCAGSGSVGLDCGMHASVAACSDPTSWIYRAHPAESPYCRADWGTSDVCSNNYNLYNSFCCRCL